MANVPEVSQFDAGIYQLETTDVVEGGSLGVDNYQAKGLANRTRWLYDKIETINTWIELTKFLLFLRKGTYVIGDVGANDYRLITFSNVGTSNYMVVGSIVSNGNGESDSEVTYAIKNKTATSFVLYLGEQGTPVQNVSFDYTLIPF